MTQKTTARQTIKKIRNYFRFSTPSKGQKKKNLFNLINKEEDEDNEQTLWPFSGKSLVGRLGFR